MLLPDTQKAFQVSLHEDYALAGCKTPKLTSVFKGQTNSLLPQAKGHSSLDGVSGGAQLTPATCAPFQGHAVAS